MRFGDCNNRLDSRMILNEDDTSKHPSQYFNFDLGRVRNLGVKTNSEKGITLSDIFVRFHTYLFPRSKSRLNEDHPGPGPALWSPHRNPVMKDPAAQPKHLRSRMWGKGSETGAIAKRSARFSV